MIKNWIIIGQALFIFGMTFLVIFKKSTPNIVYKDHIIDRIVYKDRVSTQVVNRYIHIKDKKHGTYTSIKEVLVGTTSVISHEASRSVSVNYEKRPKYSLGAFSDGKGTTLEDFKAFASMNIMGPINFIAYTDMKFADYGMGLSVEF